MLPIDYRGKNLKHFRTSPQLSMVIFDQPNCHICPTYQPNCHFCPTYQPTRSAQLSNIFGMSTCSRIVKFCFAISTTSYLLDQEGHHCLLKRSLFDILPKVERASQTASKSVQMKYFQHKNETTTTSTIVKSRI